MHFPVPGQGTMKLGRMARSVASTVNTKRRKWIASSSGYDEIGHNGKICSIYCEHKAEKRDCFLVRAVGAVEVSSIDPHHDLPSQAFLLSAIHAAIGGAVGEATQVR
uniref:Uncharacterized protein n=2 Tax=Aegilops tauschii subsp. strangulata TaxID=200361 RepID=A0A453PI77_AEGTS